MRNSNLKASVFIATSLDGFIARKNGSIDWLTQASSTAPKGEDCGYQAFMNTVDVLVMGRNSFEQVLSFPEWPYGEKRVVVLSSRKLEIPTHIQKTVSSSSENPIQLVERLSAQGAKHVYIDGGVTIQRFLHAGLIDEMTITLIPIVIGEGKPLFGPVLGDVALSLLSSRSYEFGFVQVKYAVGKV